MIIPWIDLKEECPLAIQIIEETTGFTYSAAYGTLLDEKSKPIQHEHLERFFDNQGWFMSVYPSQFPVWNGTLSDSSNEILFQDPVVFTRVKSRNHAKSLLTSITIKMFETRLQQMIIIPDTAMVLNVETDVHGHAKEKELSEFQLSDLTTDGEGLLSVAEFAVLRKGDLIRVIKNNKPTLPLVGMILKRK